MDTITITETGCYLDNHRGHYITRDVIELAEEHGFILGSFEKFALIMYEEHNHESEYPFESLIELCDEAVNWLNSGQGVCQTCLGSESLDANSLNVYKGNDDKWHCKACTGTGRGDRVQGQNFPPIIPDDTTWAFNDGDFGLYSIEDDLSDD